MMIRCHIGRAALLVALGCAGALSAQAASFKVLHDFEITDGDSPYGGLALDEGGTLYGTTLWGGKFGGGTLFKLSEQTLTVLHSFRGAADDGVNPLGDLLRDRSGRLVGTTQMGGAHSKGTIFQFSEVTGYEVLHSFAGASDGANPTSGLVERPDGVLVGSAAIGGIVGTANPWGWGTIYKFDRTARQLKTIHFFRGDDGAWPQATPSLAGGYIHGTTSGQGPNGLGGPFRLRADGSEFEAIAPTDYTNQFLTGLAKDRSGNLWGVALHGGLPGWGGLYRIGPDGTFSVRYAFSGPDGSSPNGTPIIARNGIIFGTTEYGGAYDCGTVFQFDPLSEVLVTLHEFNCSEGRLPRAGLTQGSGGVLYGTTFYGGAYDRGTVFQIKP